MIYFFLFFYSTLLDDCFQRNKNQAFIIRMKVGAIETLGSATRIQNQMEDRKLVRPTKN
jgi:hypothetical protein